MLILINVISNNVKTVSVFGLLSLLIISALLLTNRVPLEWIPVVIVIVLISGLAVGIAKKQVEQGDVKERFITTFHFDPTQTTIPNAFARMEGYFSELNLRIIADERLIKELNKNTAVMTEEDVIARTLAIEPLLKDQHELRDTIERDLALAKVFFPSFKP